MSEELKPCPFCGNQAFEVSSEVGCPDCDATVDRGAERWNTQPIEDKLRERIAELEEQQGVVHPY